MSTPSLIAVRDDSFMSSSSSPGPRSGVRRRGVLLPRCRSLTILPRMRRPSPGVRAVRICGSRASISRRSRKWRKLRDAGVLAGKRPGEKIGRLTAEQVEIARLRRELDKA